MRKLHYRTEFQGLPISIENRKGSLRHWYDPLTDEHGSTKMIHPYGYIRLTEGTDGDHVDCYIGPNKESRKVFVIHQHNPKTGKYDEDKVMLGFDSAAEAKKAYLKHYDDPKFFGSMDQFTIDTFRDKVKRKKGKIIKSQRSSGMKLYKAEVYSPSEILEKGRKGLPDGTIRTYNGMKYKKVAGDWQYLGKQEKTKKERNVNPPKDQKQFSSSSGTPNSKGDTQLDWSIEKDDLLYTVMTTKTPDGKTFSMRVGNMEEGSTIQDMVGDAYKNEGYQELIDMIGHSAAEAEIKNVDTPSSFTIKLGRNQTPLTVSPAEMKDAFSIDGHTFVVHKQPKDDASGFKKNRYSVTHLESGKALKNPIIESAETSVSSIKQAALDTMTTWHLGEIVRKFGNKTGTGKAEPTKKMTVKTNDSKKRTPSYKDPTTMTPAQINKELDGAEQVSTALNETLVKMGYGNYTNSQLRDLLTDDGIDEKAKNIVEGYLSTNRRASDLRDEIVARTGSRRPRMPQGFKARKKTQKSKPSHQLVLSKSK